MGASWRRARAGLAWGFRDARCRVAELAAFRSPSPGFAADEAVSQPGSPGSTAGMDVGSVAGDSASEGGGVRPARYSQRLFGGWRKGGTPEHPAVDHVHE